MEYGWIWTLAIDILYYSHKHNQIKDLTKDNK